MALMALHFANTNHEKQFKGWGLRASFASSTVLGLGSRPNLTSRDTFREGLRPNLSLMDTFRVGVETKFGLEGYFGGQRLAVPNRGCHACCAPRPPPRGLLLCPSRVVHAPKHSVVCAVTQSCKRSNRRHPARRPLPLTASHQIGRAHV